MQISVVIPTRNRKARLLALLAALNASTQPLHEVIVVDASDAPLQPGEWAFAEGLRIVYLRSEASVCIQRNAGIRAATAPWIFLCDDDVAVPATYLQNLAAYVQAHPDAGAVSGLWLQQDAGQWRGNYPVTAAKELILKWLFGLGTWGPVVPAQMHPFARRLAQRYARRGNHLSKAGWPVLTDFEGAVFRAPVYSLGASLVRRDWLLRAPYDEVLDRHGIGDNYGVILRFPDAGLWVLNGAHVYHHHEPANRLQRSTQYYRRALALDYFIRQKRCPAHVRRRWLLWSLLGNALLFGAKGDRGMARPALQTFWRVWTRPNPYEAASSRGETVVEPLLT